MKRLLVLFIVLALASRGNAAPSFYIDGSPADYISLAQGASVTIQIHSSDTSNWLAYIGMDISTMSPFGSVSLGYKTQNAGESGYITPYYEAGWMDGFEASSMSISGQVVAGIQHTFVYTAPMADGSTRFGIFVPPNYSWDADEVDTLTMLVPEPMTMSLLAFGGALVLIRKRRT